MSEIFGKNKKELIKEIIKRIHQGEDIKKLKEEFKESLKGLTPKAIAEIEEELIREGMGREEIQSFCALHLALFEEELEKEEILTEAGHPIHILMTEHKFLLINAKEFYEALLENKINEKLEEIIHHFKDSESHYLREENVLFPYLEKHGITQPPAIMWMEHDKIRSIKKEIYQLWEKRELNPLKEKAKELFEMLNSHFYKENKILFPTALQVIRKEEWQEIRKEFDEIGYCCFTPQEIIKKEEIKEEKKKISEILPINFETGSFSLEELEALLNTLPFDITFVDKDDIVRYFNQSKERIFLRTKAVLGRKVQQCHPQKSIHIVERILSDFKSKKRDIAEFWISYQGKLVHIRYFAVRDKKGEYLGCMEVTQDITEIKKIEGEKRIYDY
ncbi:MAG: DUF438 domain-containing protein [candidate division WOR-3 bacterium]|nr:DUF438 domain-containing protein [candidate division WOR-3 bacterium]